MAGELDLSKAYDESITRANKLLGTSLIVLALLAVVLEFELHDRPVRMAQLKAAIEEEQTNLRNAQGKLGVLSDSLKAIRLDQRDAIFQSAKRSIRQANASILDNWVSNLIKQRSDEVAKSPKERDEVFLSDLQSTINTLERLQRELPNFRTKKEKAETRIKKLESDLKKEKNTRDESIPTPFGTFKVPPRLGLLLIAFASTMAYLRFFASERRATSIAIKLASSAKESPHFPFWLYPLDSEFPGEWGDAGHHRGKLVASFVLHLGWLVFGLVVVLECVRWNAREPLWFTSLAPVEACLWLLVIVQGSFVAHRLLPVSANRKAVEAALSLRTQATRREFILLAAGAVALAVAGRWLWGAWRSRSLPHVSSGALVTNVVSDVVHHRKVCAGHLPKVKNQRAADGEVPLIRLHSGESASILESLAMNTDDDSATRYLELAIQASPRTIHLFDRLVRIYGRQKRYDQIFTILESGRAHALAALNKRELTPKEQAVLRRTAAELETRIKHARRRAAKAG